METDCESTVNEAPLDRAWPRISLEKNLIRYPTITVSRLNAGMSPISVSVFLVNLVFRRTIARVNVRARTNDARRNF